MTQAMRVASGHGLHCRGVAGRGPSELRRTGELCFASQHMTGALALLPAGAALLHGRIRITVTHNKRRRLVRI